MDAFGASRAPPRNAHANRLATQSPKRLQKINQTRGFQSSEDEMDKNTQKAFKENDQGQGASAGASGGGAAQRSRPAQQSRGGARAARRALSPKVRAAEAVPGEARPRRAPHRTGSKGAPCAPRQAGSKANSGNTADEEAPREAAQAPPRQAPCRPLGRGNLLPKSEFNERGRKCRSEGRQTRPEHQRFSH